jgi:hypothetical protein
MKTYVAHYEHDGRAWVVTFGEPDISTSGRSLRAAKRYARELLAAYLEVDDLVSADVEVVNQLVADDVPHTSPGTLATSVLSTAIDEADPDPRSITDLLDWIPGAWEDARAGAEDISARRYIPLEDL